MACISRVAFRLCLALLWACWAKPSLASVPTVYQPDYDEGYGVGYSEGYDSGFATGEAKGEREGSSAGEKYGYDAGWDDAYQPAYDEAYNAQYPVGLKAGYDEGLVVGFDKGFDWASRLSYSVNNGNVVLWNGGNSSGAVGVDVSEWSNGSFLQSLGAGALIINSGSLGLPQYDWAAHYFDEGYDDGHGEGLLVGNQEGYDQAYPLAYKAAFDVAYPEGFEAGTAKGLLHGSEAGFDNGWDDGYDFGYAEGFDFGAEHYRQQLREYFQPLVLDPPITYTYFEPNLVINIANGTIPEPTTATLFGMAAVGSLLLVRRPR